MKLSADHPNVSSPDTLKISDSHCHLADPRLETKVLELVAEAKSKGIRFFLQGGVGPEDWQRQIELQKKIPEIGLCFGLHPYWVSDHGLEDCESAMDLLARMLPKALALGELGLDFRPHIVKDRREQQIDFFIQQLELAEVSSKPMVFHLVRAFDEVMEIFRHHLWAGARGMIHSFNGSAIEAEKYLGYDFYLSIGGPVCREDNQKLHQALAITPLSRILLESDSPDQPPPSLKNQLNEPSTIFQVAEKIAQIKKCDRHEVLDFAGQNLEKLLYGKSNQSQF